MFKAMILLKKNKNMQKNDFANWWLGKHSKMASKLPKIRKLCFNLVESGGSEEYDGIAEQWFDSKEDFIDAYESDIGKKVAADSMSNVQDRIRIFVNENQIV